MQSLGQLVFSLVILQRIFSTPIQVLVLKAISVKQVFSLCSESQANVTQNSFGKVRALQL
jgi:hypothetical protein